MSYVSSDRWTDMYADRQADAQKHRAHLTSLTLPLKQMLFHVKFG